jgi:glycosyltransferase involved in cell wall biosynthesis
MAHARGLARGLRDQGLHVSLLCTGAAPPDADPAFDRIIARQPRSLPLLWRIPPLGALPFWIRSARAAVADVDAVISLAPVMALATRWARQHVPLVYAPASLLGLERNGGPRGAYRWIEQRVLQSTNRVLLTTPAVRGAVEALYGPLKAAVAVCPLGVSAGRSRHPRRSRAELGIPADARLLLTVGPLIENKGQRIIAQALARCRHANWWWAILGAGPDKGAICHALRDSALQTRVRFIERDAHPADWYAAADVLVAASRVETFGLVIAEALHAGMPVVIPRDEPGTTLSPLADSVQTFRLGRTYPRTDTAALAAALADILADEQELTATGRRAATYARADFSWARYAYCALQLLQNPADITFEPVRPEAIILPPESAEQAVTESKGYAYASADGS